MPERNGSTERGGLRIVGRGYQESAKLGQRWATPSGEVLVASYKDENGHCWAVTTLGQEPGFRRGGMINLDTQREALGLRLLEG